MVPESSVLNIFDLARLVRFGKEWYRMVLNGYGMGKNGYRMVLNGHSVPIQYRQATSC